MEAGAALARPFLWLRPALVLLRGGLCKAAPGLPQDFRAPMRLPSGLTEARRPPS